MKNLAATVLLVVFFVFLSIVPLHAADYKYNQTKDLVGLVRNAGGLIQDKGEAAFPEFKQEGSEWKNDKMYLFVVDADGNMVFHPDVSIQGGNQINMKDINGKPVIKGIIDEVNSNPNGEGWMHYQWPNPGTIFASWKSTFAKKVVAPSGKGYIVCSGLYNMKVEEDFVVDMVNRAVALIEKEGKAAFDKLHDKSTQFVILGTYIFVDTPEGVEIVNGGFPDVEGKNILDHKDPTGKYLTREIIATALNKGSGWVDYMWPRPGETTPSKKHSYVKMAEYNGEKFAVGAGVYVEPETPATSEKAESVTGKLMVLEFKSGEKAAGEVVRETKDSIYLVNPDGSMEVSFPRDKIVKTRKPTEAELAKIKGVLAAKDKKTSP